MELCSANKTPTSQTALRSDPEGPPIKEAWKYSSVFGMLLYLSTNTRPDIAFAVSKAAVQLQSQPVSCISFQDDHQASIRQRHHLHPTTDIKVDRYVDADFT